METTCAPAGSIVVGADGSESADRALTWAAQQAVLERRPLSIVHAVGPLGMPGTVWLSQGVAIDSVVLQEMQAEGNHLLDRAENRVASISSDVVVTKLLRFADPRQALLDLAPTTSMMVLGSRGRGPVRSLLLGSVSVAVSRHATCPVVVVRPHNPGTVRNGVLVGVDGTSRSLPTLEFAYRQASFRGLPLTVTHCYWNDSGHDPEELRLVLSESVSGMSEKFPDVHVTLALSPGSPGDLFVDSGQRMDLVVVGWHQTGFRTGPVFGSVAPHVLEHAECVVAVVPDQVDQADHAGPRASGD